MEYGHLLTAPNIAAALAALLLLVSIRVIDQNERGIRLTLGKFNGRILQPGLCLEIPLLHVLEKVDMREEAVEVPEQQALTKDSVSVRVTAVVYYSVADCAKAVLDVSDFWEAIIKLGETTLRNEIGCRDLNNLLTNREAVSTAILKDLKESAERWGLAVRDVQIKDISMPDSMMRSMAAVAEATREAEAIVIRADAEETAAKKISAAAAELASNPAGIALRTLQTIQSISGDPATKIILMPVDLMGAMTKVAQGLQ